MRLYHSENEIDAPLPNESSPELKETRLSCINCPKNVVKVSCVHETVCILTASCILVEVRSRTMLHFRVAYALGCPAVPDCLGQSGTVRNETKCPASRKLAICT